MQFGVALPNLGGSARTELLCSLVRLVEELGYDSLWVSDHVVMPTRIESRYPYRSSGEFILRSEEDILEPMPSLTFLAALTQRVRLGISVQVLPYRNPVLNAKMLTTLDVLSNGRTIVGVGVGWMKEEFEVLDADYASRGAVTDEHIKIFRALCTEEDPTFSGKHHHVGKIKFFPKPVQKPHPPVWVGGTSSRAIHRAATLGEGWHAVRMRPLELARGRERVLRLRSESGLDTDGFGTTLEITEEPLGDRRVPFRGSLQQVAEDLREYEDAGAAHIVLAPGGDDFEAMAHNLRRFADEVIPRP